MQSVNFYQLLSKVINDNQGNTGNQTDAVINYLLIIYLYLKIL